MANILRSIILLVASTVAASALTVGKKTSGSYTVALPDGRLQVVTYPTADGEGSPGVIYSTIPAGSYPTVDGEGSPGVIYSTIPAGEIFEPWMD